MATTLLSTDGIIGIPRCIEHFKKGETVYCLREHGSYRVYLSKSPLRQYLDSHGIDRSPELLCSMKVEKNRIKLPEDVLRKILWDSHGQVDKLSVTKGFTYNGEAIYLNQIR